MFEIVQRRFFTGLITVVPAVITIWAIHLLVGLLDWLLADRIRPIIADLFLILGWPRVLVGTATLGMSLVLTLGLIVMVGTISKLYMGRRLIRLGESIVERIPIVRLFYVTPKEVLRILTNSQSANTKRVVLIEFPRPGVWALAYATGEMIHDNDGCRFITVFMPSTPNPTTGFLMLLPEDQVRDYNLTTEASVRMVISGGILTPSSYRSAPFAGLSSPPPFDSFVGSEDLSRASEDNSDDDHPPASSPRPTKTP